LNKKVLFAGLGFILFAILSILLISLGDFAVQADRFQYVQIPFFIFISLAIVLIGLGFLEIYKREEDKFAFIIFDVSIVCSVLLFIYNVIILPIVKNIETGSEYLVVGLITYIIFTVFFIILGIFFILNREDLGNERMGLISGILTIIFAVLLLIFVSVLCGTYISYASAETLNNELYQLILISLLFGNANPNDIIVILILMNYTGEILGSLSNILIYLELIMKYLGLLLLGISQLVTGIYLLVIAKFDFD